MKYLTLFLIFSIAGVLGQELCRLQSGVLGTCTIFAFCPYVQAMSKILTVENLVETYGGCGRGSDGNVQLCCPNDKSLSDGRQGGEKLTNFTLTDVTSTSMSTTPRPAIAAASTAGSTGHFWVGVRNRTWLDGRAVAKREWRSGDPDGAQDECGFMGSNGTPQSYFLYDFPCDGESHAICHKRLDIPN